MREPIYNVPEGARLIGHQHVPDIMLPVGEHSAQEIVDFMNSQDTGGHVFFVREDGKIADRVYDQVFSAVHIQ